MYFVIGTLSPVLLMDNTSGDQNNGDKDHYD